MRTKVLASIYAPLDPDGITKAWRALRHLGDCVQVQPNLFEINTSLPPSQINIALRQVLDSPASVYCGYVAVTCAS